MEIMNFSFFFMMLSLGFYSSASENLQRQKRDWVIDSFSIDEGNTKPYPYSLGKIQLEKNLTIFKISGAGVDEDPKGILKINQHTGEITVHGPVDYERYHSLKVKFQALDKHKRTVDTQLSIEITIIDSNDNPPKFDLQTYKITIQESILQGTELITLKATDEDSIPKNMMFDLKIVSVTPKPQDLEFYLTQTPGAQTGTISFKGCLDHKKAKKYTIVVEAKDHGEPEKLSSSCTVIVTVEDGNNNLPVITGLTGPGKVKEGQENVLVSRLQVTDEDTKGTAAWRAKYQIQGDTIKSFRITTDPETNEGLLYVEKPLNYEDSPQKNVTVIVENEIPYYSCKVVSRHTTGLWELVTTSDFSGLSGKGITISLSSYHVTVTVEDVNESPVFDKPNKQVKLVENVAVGQYLETFTARDPDSQNTFVYIKGEDPADWVTVDPVTGKITTSKIIDRESLFVKDSIYKVTIYAVDKGKPPMTGTAMLSIYISDENDNVPSLNVSTIDICQSSGLSLAKITVFDLDEDPYAGPFHFKLIGDVAGSWKVDPDQGYSVNLIKENTIHSGYYELFLEVSDHQGETTVHNLSVTVCHCLDTARPNCRFRKATGSRAGGGALLIIFFSILMFAGILLLAFLMSSTKETFPLPDDSTGHLMTSNTETRGTDCKVVFDLNAAERKASGKHNINTHQVLTRPEQMNLGMKSEDRMQMTDSSNGACSKSSLSRSKSVTVEQMFTRRSNMYRSMGASSTATLRQHGNATGRTWVGQSNEYQRSDVQRSDVQRKVLLKVLNKMMYSLQAPGVELDDYVPHVYVEEGDLETNFELEEISIPDIPFDPDLDLDLDDKFNTLATVCMDYGTTA